MDALTIRKAKSPLAIEVARVHNVDGRWLWHVREMWSGHVLERYRSRKVAVAVGRALARERRSGFYVKNRRKTKNVIAESYETYRPKEEF